MGYGNKKRVTQTDITIPSLANVVRAWSLRRNIPAYALGNAIKELRESGGAETNVPFLNDGTITLAGADAFANVLYDQMGADASKLLQATFANCPKVFESSAMLKGLRFADTSDKLAMGATDASIQAALAAVETAGVSVSMWVKVNSASAGHSVLLQRINDITGNLRLSVALASSTVYLVFRSAAADAKSGGNLSAGWNLVTFTCKGADGAVGGLKIYRNAGTPAAFDVPAVAAGLTPANLFVGSMNTGGSMDINDVIIWNTELSAGQITALFNAQCGYYGVSAK